MAGTALLIAAKITDFGSVSASDVVNVSFTCVKIRF